MAITVNATNQIQLYTSAGSTDAVNDYFLGYNNSATAYRKYNRNTLLGITGAPVGTTDTQTISGKTLIAPTINGGTFSGTFTGTYTFGGTPTFPTSIVTLTSTQTLTNKTLTSPVITGGTIDNTSITVDSISGHTTSTIVTVGGVQMNNGIIGTSGAVTSTSIAPSAVQPQALQSGTGTGWSYQSFTPTFTNLTVGNGVLTARYNQTGKTVSGRLSLVFGSSTTVTGGVSFTLPVTAVVYAGSAGLTILGNGLIYDVSATKVYNGTIGMLSTTTGEIRAEAADLPFVYSVPLNATSPMTFAVGDEMSFSFSYEAA